jgi:hypothetical protein
MMTIVNVLAVITIIICVWFFFLITSFITWIGYNVWKENSK